uniref:Uncharacterized protein n=1 Tax=Oryza punctata TaxID=4537 RepID=A0A0E0MPR7_ORYPU
MDSDMNTAAGLGTQNLREEEKDRIFFLCSTRETSRWFCRARHFWKAESKTAIFLLQICNGGVAIADDPVGRLLRWHQEDYRTVRTQVAVLLLVSEPPQIDRWHCHVSLLLKGGPNKPPRNVRMDGSSING